MSPKQKPVSNHLSSCNTGNDTTITLMLDSVAYPEKPVKGGPEYAKIPNRLGKSLTTLTIPQLIDAALNGQSFLPSVFKNGRCITTNWVSQQVFAFDFDSGSKLDTFWEINNKYGIMPCCVYPSFNFTPEDHRFRAIYVCDQVITDFRLRKLVQTTFFDMFCTKMSTGKLNPDPLCNRPHQYFLGTNKPPIYTALDACFNPIELVDNYLKVKKAEDPAHFQRFRTGFASDNHVKLCKTVNRGFFFFSSYADEQPNGETLAAPSSIYNGRATNSPNSVALGSEPDYQADFQTEVVLGDATLKIMWTIDVDTCLHNPNKSRNKRPEPQNKKINPSSQDCKVSPPKRLIRISESKEHLIGGCRLLREFMEGTRKLNHPEKLLIGSNMLGINGGPKFYNECLKSRTDYDYPDETFADITDRKYKPQGCARNCPFDDECNHRKNLLQQIPIKRNEYRRIYDSPNRKTLDETQVQIRDALNNALNEPYPSVTVIKSDTGSGKTEQLKHVDISGACIAFDKHSLKREAFERIAGGNGKKAFLWNIPPLLPEQMQLELDRIQELGITGTMQLYRDALENEEVRQNMTWQQEIVAYLNANERAHKVQHQFTTHAKAIQLKHINTMLFDEDPINTFIRIVAVEIPDIKLMIQAAKEQDSENGRYIASHLNRILRARADTAHVIRDRYHPAETLYGLINKMPRSFRSNIGLLFTGNAYIRAKTGPWSPEKVYVVDKRLPPPDTKIIILSATADEYIYRKLFGNRLNFVDLSGTKTKGLCILHPGRGYSKRSIRDLEEDAFIEQVMADKEKYGFEAVITHKFIAEKLNEHVPVLGHFGGLAGIDAWGGQRIAVYGTPHRPGCVYQLYAHVLGIPCRDDDIDFGWYSVFRGEFEFRTHMWSEIPVLQDLQLWTIEAELAQAVGRARLIHHENVVHLFSAVPVPGCVIDDEIPGGGMD